MEKSTLLCRNVLSWLLDHMELHFHLWKVNYSFLWLILFFPLYNSFYLDILEAQKFGFVWKPTDLPITHVDVECPLNFSPFCRFVPQNKDVLQPTDPDAALVVVPEGANDDFITVDQLDVESDGSIDIPDDGLVPSPFKLSADLPKIQPNAVPFGAVKSRYPMGNCNNMHRRPDQKFSLNPDRTLYVNPLVSFVYFWCTTIDLLILVFILIFQDNPEHGVITALSDNPATVIHQDQESPLRTSDQKFDFFFTEEGGLVCRELKSVTHQMLQDRRIYGKNYFLDISDVQLSLF